MNIKPTQILSDEHKNILKVIEALEAKCKKIEDGAEADKDFFSQATDFIRNYADKFHHAKEEDILFKEFCSHAEELHCNPVEQMLYEHDLGRKFVKGIEEGLQKNDKSKIIESAQSYCLLLREHIFKEDNILYPMSDEALGSEIQDRISQNFSKVIADYEHRGLAKKYTDFANNN